MATASDCKRKNLTDLAWFSKWTGASAADRCQCDAGTCANMSPGFPPSAKGDVVEVKAVSALDELKELVYASAECRDEKARKRILDIAFRQCVAKLGSNTNR